MEYSYYKNLEPFFGQWYIDEKIGEGSFGKVFKIKKTDIGGEVSAALKIITIPKDNSEINTIQMEGNDPVEYYKDVTNKVYKECLLMNKLRGNSNIVSCDDYSLRPHDDGIGWDIFIRMELLTPLYAHLKNKKLTMRDVADLGIDLCKGLELCRKYNIIHRDIKPENIFISPNGDYKLGDFGTAKTTEKTTSGTKIGTFPYMAPEIYRSEPYGSTVDICSLGIVMYSLLNNMRTPFLPVDKKYSMMDKEIANGRRLKGEKLQPPYFNDERLSRIVLKACSHNPKDRYSTAYEMRCELESIRNDLDGTIPCVLEIATASQGINSIETKTLLQASGTDSVSSEKSDVNNSSELNRTSDGSALKNDESQVQVKAQLVDDNEIEIEEESTEIITNNTAAHDNINDFEEEETVINPEGINYIKNTAGEDSLSDEKESHIKEEHIFDENKTESANINVPDKSDAGKTETEVEKVVVVDTDSSLTADTGKSNSTENENEESAKFISNEESAKKKNLKLPIIIAVIALIVVGAAIYFIIPKEISDIKGLNSKETILYGEKLTPKYEIVPQLFKNEKITIKSSDNSIVQINSKNELIAKNPGNAKITLSARNYKKEVSITVKAKVSSISNIKSSYVIEKGKTLEVNPKLNPKKYSNEKTTYRISNKKVASVTSKGVIKGIKQGKTELLIKAGGYTKKVKIVITNPVTNSQSNGTATYNSNPANSGGSYYSEPNLYEKPKSESKSAYSDNPYDEDVMIVYEE